MPDAPDIVLCSKLCRHNPSNPIDNAHSNVPVKLTLEIHPPRAFELLKIGLFKFPPLGAIEIPHQLVLKYLSSKANFVFSQTLLTLFRERSAVVMIPSNFL